MSWAWSTPLESRLRSPPTGLYGLSDRYADQDMYADHTLINAGTDPGPFQRTATQLHINSPANTTTPLQWHIFMHRQNGSAYMAAVRKVHNWRAAAYFSGCTQPCRTWVAIITSPQSRKLERSGWTTPAGVGSNCHQPTYWKVGPTTPTNHEIWQVSMGQPQLLHLVQHPV